MRSKKNSVSPPRMPFDWKRKSASPPRMDASRPRKAESTINCFGRKPRWPIKSTWQFGVSIPGSCRRWPAKDSRPFAHYIALHSPFIALTCTGETCTPGQFYLPSPLMTAEIPDWMILHFQVDTVNGWMSPQVIPDFCGNSAQATSRIEHR